jgi:hypothetical protein
MPPACNTFYRDSFSEGEGEEKKTPVCSAQQSNYSQQFSDAQASASSFLHPAQTETLNALAPPLPPKP